MQRRTFISAAIGSVAGIAGMILPGSMARGTVTASGVHPYQGAALAFGTTITVTVLHHDQRQAELARIDSRNQMVLGIVSLSLAIPLSAIFAGISGLVGGLVVWIGIILVNMAYAMRKGRRDDR